MAIDVTMPRLSDSMEEGVVLSWLVEVGAEVRRGEPLVEIETDKATMTYDADADGVLLEQLVHEGEAAPLGAIIARIGAPGEVPQGAARPSDEPGPARPMEGHATATLRSERSAQGPAATTAPSTPAAGNGGGPRVKASPVARRVAAHLGIDLAALVGSGPNGRVVKSDVLSAAGASDAAPPASPSLEPTTTAASAPAAIPAPDGAKGAVETIEPSRLQQVVARRMSESKQTAPDFALHVEIDMTEAIALRARLKQLMDPAPTFNDMVVKACAVALREHPRANGSYRDGRFELHARVNVGIAVAARDALVVPTVHDADKKSLGEIARAARELADKVRRGAVTPAELDGGTFTVSNLGMFGIESFVAVINPPQAGILAVGALKKKPVVDESGEIVARDLMSATLVSDHRILYGAQSAQFVNRIRELLEQPLVLLAV